MLCCEISHGNRLKNESSLFSMTVRELTTQYRLLLTGTPLQVRYSRCLELFQYSSSCAVRTTVVLAWWWMRDTARGML